MESKKSCLTDSEARAWTQAARRSSDDIVIENAPRLQDLTCDPYPRQMTHADRVFLNDCGVFLHMLSWRDGYYWKAKEGADRARTSASSKNFSSRTGWCSNGGENEERGVHQLPQNQQVHSVEGADAVI
jgi:hypothetical protein